MPEGELTGRALPFEPKSYITKTFPFTSDVPAVQQHLSTLYASGGGDGPEAVSAALGAALNEVEWRPAAAKMVVLVADAPAHGLGGDDWLLRVVPLRSLLTRPWRWLEYGDGERAPLNVDWTRHLPHERKGFPNGSPDGNDPLQIARAMASRGITML